MGQGAEPTIKGIFVNSHIRAVRGVKGAIGIALLEQKLGHPVNFANSQDVPVAEEIRIIEAALNILEPNIPADQRAFEAGRLHFRNFSTTPLARLLFSFFSDAKQIFLRSKYVAEHVFRGITFSSEEVTPNTITITLTGGLYPLDHFKGLFWAWLEFAGYQPDVTAQQLGPEKYQYILRLIKKES